MAWSNGFTAKLQGDTIRPRWLLEVFQWGNHAGIPGGVTLKSDGSSLISIEGVSISGAELQLRDWDTSFGSWAVDVVGPASAFFPSMQRGQVYRLRLGFPGWSEGDYQTVAIGMLKNIKGKYRTFRLSFGDPVSSLKSRIDTGADQWSLFYGTPASTSLKSGTSYTAADSFLRVASNTGFEKEDDGGGTLLGGVVITSTSDPSARVLLEYAGTSTDTTSDRFDTTSIAYGSFDEDVAQAGSSVAEVYFVEDHPLDFAAKVLCSTGANDAAGFDTLPDSWGFGINQEYLDLDDMAAFKAQASPSSGVDDMQFISETEQLDPVGWLEGELKSVGFFLTMRQGLLTARAVLNPNQHAVTSADINDTSILALRSWQAYDTSTPFEYNDYVTQWDNNADSNPATLTQSEGIKSLPAKDSITNDVVGRIQPNAANWRPELNARLADWHNRIPERLELVVRLYWAKLAPGDIVTVTSSSIQGRLPSTRDGYSQRPCLVLKVDTDWLRGSVSLTLSTLPSDEDVI